MKTVVPLITLISAALVAGKPISLGTSDSVALRGAGSVQVPSNVLNARNQEVQVVKVEHGESL